MALSECSPPRGVGESPGADAYGPVPPPSGEERRNRPSDPESYFLALTWTSVKIGSPSWP